MCARIHIRKNPMPSAAQPSDNVSSLKRNALSYPEVIAQSVSVIAPSTVPAAILGLIFATAGSGTWLSFLMATIGLVFVCANINQFARRSASPGSLYTYIVKGLGPMAGVLSGWGLLFGYMVTGMSTLCGFGLFTQMLLSQIGFPGPILLMFVFATIGSFLIAYKDIQLSAKAMLILEGLSLVFIVSLGIVVWAHKGFALDLSQVTLRNASPGGIVGAIVLVVFAFSGFESSTSLGDEAKNPLRTVPRSLLQSTLFAGAFFLFMAYVTILGFEGSGADLAKTEAPLGFLAQQSGVGFLGVLINIGAALSFFSCTLACINSTARILFSMARHGLFHDALGSAHLANKTPYVAVAVSALITLLVPAAVHLTGISAFDAQGYFGTLCSFGFLLAYILICVAAPLYLRSIGKLRKIDIIYSVLGIGFMILPLIGSIGLPGSELFPPPSFPTNLFIWIFVVYMLTGLGWLLVQKLRFPTMTASMKTSMDELDLKFSEAKER